MSPSAPVENEGRIILAVNALKKKQISSIQEASRTYDVPYTTLYERITANLQDATYDQNRVNSLPSRRKLFSIVFSTLTRKDILPGYVTYEKWRILSSQTVATTPLKRLARIGLITLSDVKRSSV